MATGIRGPPRRLPRNTASGRQAAIVPVNGVADHQRPGGGHVGTGELDEGIHLGCEVGGEAPRLPVAPTCRRGPRRAGRRALRGKACARVPSGAAVRSRRGATCSTLARTDARSVRSPLHTVRSWRRQMTRAGRARRPPPKASALIQRPHSEPGRVAGRQGQAARGSSSGEKLCRNVPQGVWIAGCGKMPRLGAFEQRRQARADAFACPLERGRRRPRCRSESVAP